MTEVTASLKIADADAEGGFRPLAVADLPDPAVIAALATSLTALLGQTDQVEGPLASIVGFVDGLETLLAATNTALATLDGHVDGLEGFTDGIEGLLTGLQGYVDGLEALVGTSNTNLTQIHTDIATTLVGYVDGLETLATAANALETTIRDRLTSPVMVGSRPVIGDQRKFVTTPGTAVALAATTPCSWVQVTAETDNTGVIVVGRSTVVAALGTRRGTPLNAGDSVTLPCDDLANVYIDATVGTDGVTFLYG